MAETNSFYSRDCDRPPASRISSIAAARRVSSGLDENTIAFADYSGNRQYITQGNLAENPKAHSSSWTMRIAGASRSGARRRGRRRSGADKALMPRLQGAPRAGHPVPFRRGTPIVRSTSRRNSTRPTWRRRWPRVTRASLSSRPNWPH